MCIKIKIFLRQPKQLNEAQVFRDTPRMLDAIVATIDRIKKQPNPDPLALSPLVYSMIAGLTPGAVASISRSLAIPVTRGRSKFSRQKFLP